MVKEFGDCKGDRLFQR